MRVVRFVFGVILAGLLVAGPATAHEGGHMLVGAMWSGVALTVQAHADGEGGGSGWVSLGASISEIDCVAVQHLDGVNLWRISAVDVVSDLQRHFILRTSSSQATMDAWNVSLTASGDLCGAPSADSVGTGIGKFVELNL